MSTHTTPAKTVITCDCCGKTCGAEPGQVRRVYSGGLIVKKDALDFQGYAVADASVKRDLCDSCLHIVSAAVNQACEAVRVGIPAPAGIPGDGEGAKP